MDGCIVVNKPKGCTSFDVVASLRKILGQKKIGHTGTLDPIATGVLPILLGSATKMQQFMKQYSKEYIAVLKLGIVTDTEDITGKILKTSTPNVCLKDLKDALLHFLGEIYQIPPMFSAIKIGGKKLCDLAREGIEIEREKRLVNITDISLLNYDDKQKTAQIKVTCSPGTYIRSLISDIGKFLSCGATMVDLVRTKSNGFSIENSFTLEEIRAFSLDELNNVVINTQNLLGHYNKVYITGKQKNRFKNGLGLSLERLIIPKDFLKEGKIFQVISEEDLIGLGKVDIEKQELTVLKIFRI